MSTSTKQPWGTFDTDTTRWSARQLRALTIVAALVVNLIILGIGRVVNGEFPLATVGDDVQTIGIAPVIGVTVLVGLVAWGLLALLERLMPQRARATWTVIAIVVFLLSLLGPLGSGENTSSQVVLALMHIGAAATIIPLLRRSTTVRE